MDFVLLFLGGVLLGGASCLFFSIKKQRTIQLEFRACQAKLEAKSEALAEAQKDLAVSEAQRTSEQQLSDRFRALSADALSRNSDDFLRLARTTLDSYQARAQNELGERQKSIEQTVTPVGEALSQFNERISSIEARRIESETTLKVQLQQLAQSHNLLSQSTQGLVQALRAPQVRGQWGEMQLRRTVEMAGMVNYCDFLEQQSVDNDSGQRQRPDMIIRLPNERSIIVDSKVPLAAYLDAMQSDNADVQSERMVAHARHLREHIKGLSTKQYWSQFDDSPEFVVLFVPNESIFSAALEQSPDLIEVGVSSQVILATPTTLIALLKAIAYGWQQAAVAKEAKEISKLGKELYDRIGIVMGHFGKLGKNLDSSVECFNATLRSVDSRLLVTAKKFQSLDSAGAESIEEVVPIERLPKKIEAEV